MSKSECLCTLLCDCQRPEPDDGEVALISNGCPVHNVYPEPSRECPIHGGMDPITFLAEMKKYVAEIAAQWG